MHTSLFLMKSLGFVQKLLETIFVANFISVEFLCHNSRFREKMKKMLLIEVHILLISSQTLRLRQNSLDAFLLQIY